MASSYDLSLGLLCCYVNATCNLKLEKNPRCIRKTTWKTCLMYKCECVSPPYIIFGFGLKNVCILSVCVEQDGLHAAAQSNCVEANTMRVSAALQSELGELQLSFLIQTSFEILGAQELHIYPLFPCIIEYRFCFRD